MAVATNNKRTSKPVTVFQAVQRERSRPFQGDVREYQKEIRENAGDRPMPLPIEAKGYVYGRGTKKISSGERGRRFANWFENKARRAAKISSNVIERKTVRGLSLLQRGGIARAMYGQPAAPYGSNIPNVPRTRYTGRRGRPMGTVKYKDAQGNPIDVYTWRKMQSQMRWKERQAYLNSIAVTPSQRMALEQLRRQQQYQQSNPEGKIIPSTNGFVPINDIMNEADSYSRIFE